MNLTFIMLYVMPVAVGSLLIGIIFALEGLTNGQKRL